MKITISTILITAVMIVGVLQAQLITPVNLQQQKCQTEAKMEKMGFPITLIPSINLASQQTKLSPEFIIALMHSESGFDERAISSKGYKGLMQIPYAVYYPDANILIGARIFQEKMVLAKGNMIMAIILYKGYANDIVRGRMQAEKVLRLYHKLKEMEV